MNETFGASIVQKYNTQKYNKNFLCLGTKKECWSEINKGAKQISFGKSLVNENVEGVILKPDIKKIATCKSLDFLPQSITFLDIPLPLLRLVSKSNLHNLTKIRVNNKDIYMDDKSLVESCVLDESLNLEYLHFYGDCEEAGEFWVNTNIDITKYQNLDFFSSVLDKDNRIIKQIGDIKNIKYLDIYAIHKNNILDFICHLGLKMLSLNQIEAGFNFEKLDRFKNLEILTINDCKSSFDCSLLKKLPKIKEIDFMGIKKIINPEILLDIDALESVTIVDCKNPLKKKGIEKFSNHNFSYLDVEFS